MTMTTYQVTQTLEWACPNMLIFVHEGQIVGQQANPANALTQEWAEEGETWGTFNPAEYAECKLVL